jgi:putative flippase GtrA
MIITSSRERVRFFRFAIVGAIGAVIDFSIFNILTSFLKVPVIIAQAFSFSIAVTSNFLWNRFWTYPDSRSKRVAHQVIQFFVVNVVGLLIRTPLIGFLGPVLVALAARLYLPISVSSNVIGHNLALAIAVGVVMLWNFFINRFWTYSDVEVK